MCDFIKSVTIIKAGCKVIKCKRKEYVQISSLKIKFILQEISHHCTLQNKMPTKQ